MGHLREIEDLEIDYDFHIDEIMNGIETLHISDNGEITIYSTHVLIYLEDLKNDWFIVLKRIEVSKKLIPNFA